jgi:hypothetical protein
MKDLLLWLSINVGSSPAVAQERHLSDYGWLGAIPAHIKAFVMPTFLIVARLTENDRYGNRIDELRAIFPAIRHDVQHK